ncbi:MAG: 50S ribosomal protein L23 [Chitinophagales bacterium]|nr:50S ribosomal protein L23 [Chitinophagales bacterium]
MGILKRPIITEKMTKLGEKLNRFGFIVEREANKLEIKKAVEGMYGVTVKSVNTMVIPGKTKSRQTKTGMTKGMKKPYKKAIVTLNAGETIDFYSNV